MSPAEYVLALTLAAVLVAVVIYHRARGWLGTPAHNADGSRHE